VVGLWGEGCIAVLAVHRDAAAVQGIIDHARSTVRRVAEMHIHHPRASLQKVVTVTAALATVTPERSEEEPARLTGLAEDTLRLAKLETRGALRLAGQ
jgi:PleD family two-component response regulator